MRIQVVSQPDIGDGRAAALLMSLQLRGHEISTLSVANIYLVHGVPELSPDRAHALFCDPVAQRAQVDSDTAPAGNVSDAWSHLVEITYRPGVANPEATSIREALAAEFGGLPEKALVQTARQYFVNLATPEQVDAVAGELHNGLIEQASVIARAEWESGARPPARYPAVESTSIPPVETISILNLSDTELESLSVQRLLALTLPEMQTIRDYYALEETRTARAAAGLPEDPTDVELELLAQTWSEHCKHKIFAAAIDYTDERGGRELVDGLFQTYIKATTTAIGRPEFVKSVFDDNAGVVRFNDDWLVCIKAETHNSPSALDPYGGAITGIVGVNRDILGTGKGARPIFNTDVLCFGYPDVPPESMPAGLLHPRVILEGVHRGIVDGGNQSGIPVAAGGLLFDASYTGKPLVFCGTAGLLPSTIGGEDAWIKHIDAGDLAVMVGGRIGKDGIHGATFSSLALDESSPTTAVQIGEPITQKKMTEFLLEARDALLIKGITDNGAGGLSSSLGEMAEESGGVSINLDACPLKYKGLAAWEILVSESQERMSLAIDPAKLPALEALAAKHDVEVSVVGRFTDDGRISVTHQGTMVAQLSLDFVHEGLPQMQLEAVWPGASCINESGHLTDTPTPLDLHDALIALLSDPNAGNKEYLVRQYDHEVQAGSVVKPFCGPQADGPTDGAVIRPIHEGMRGVTVTHGIAPRLSEFDSYAMAISAVDEAMRAHVAVGGDPNEIAALDNFCWPDPVRSEKTPDGPYKLAQLVRACRGLADACTAYGMPLVSGKDSMKNDANLGGTKVSIKPTLLVTAMGICPDIRSSTTTDFKHAGDVVYIVGDDKPSLAGALLTSLAPHLIAYAASELGSEDAALAAPATNLAANRELYAALSELIASGVISSIHDIADGGLAAAVSESAIGGNLGATLTFDAPAGETTAANDTPVAPADAIVTLFGEGTGRFVLTVSPEHAAEVEQALGASCRRLGTVTEAPLVAIEVCGYSLSWQLADLKNAWNAFSRSMGHTGSPRTTAGGEVPTPCEPMKSKTRRDSASSRREKSPRVALLTGLGINADRELAAAFAESGALVEPIHVNALLESPRIFERVQIVALPGGFSYGDHVGSGIMLAHRLASLRESFDNHVARGGLVLGICNGFQVLVKMGLLPNASGDWSRTASLVHNKHGVFEDSWVTVRREERCTSPWLDGVGELDVPIRHGEGRFVAAGEAALDALERDGQIALRYYGRNPNGSSRDVAGIVDPTGRVLGMMPHPEAFLMRENHPHWRSRTGSGAQRDGLIFFENAVRWAARSV